MAKIILCVRRLHQAARLIEHCPCRGGSLAKEPFQRHFKGHFKRHSTGYFKMQFNPAIDLVAP